MRRTPDALAAAGARDAAAKNKAEMASLDTQLEELELMILRRGVWAREADRSRCTDCGRTPLTGEEVHVFDGRRRRIVCELCRTAHRDTPIATEVVRHVTHGQNVRLTARAA